MPTACSNRTGAGAQFYYSDSTAVTTALTTAVTSLPSIPSTATSWRLLSIAPFSFSRPSIPDSSLLTTNFEEVLPGDRYAIEPLVMQVLWDYTTDTTYMFDSTKGINTNFDCVGSGYLFPPDIYGSGTFYYLAGTGFITDIQFPNLQANERQIGRITFQFDAKLTEPFWYTHTKTG